MDAVVPLPSIQLIGAQKAGTSAIADWLFENGGYERPKVFGDEPWYYSKETHFFDIDSRFCSGLHFYARRVESSNSMDATPDTLAFPERVHSIYSSEGGDQVDTVRFIVVLRDQVQRELSLYNHLAFDCRNLLASERNSWHNQVLKEDGSIMTFDEFVRDVSFPALGKKDSEDGGKGRSSRHGLYADHLQRWFDLFDRKQLLVVSYEELRGDPDRVQGRISSFLGRGAIPGKLRWTNSNDSQHKVRSPSAEAKEALLSIFSAQNKRLHQMLEDRPGPPEEQLPFPLFST